MLLRISFKTLLLLLLSIFKKGEVLALGIRDIVDGYGMKNRENLKEKFNVKIYIKADNCKKVRE
jgi:hypothetical protein